MTLGLDGKVAIVRWRPKHRPSGLLTLAGHGCDIVVNLRTNLAEARAVAGLKELLDREWFHHQCDPDRARHLSRPRRRAGAGPWQTSRLRSDAAATSGRGSHSSRGPKLPDRACVYGAWRASFETTPQAVAAWPP